MKILLPFIQTKKTPFTLSLSKGGWASRSCFDKLSTNGLIVDKYVFSIMDSLVTFSVRSPVAQDAEIRFTEA
jgi:hypothetical protein